MKKRIVLGMSGGLDSSVSAYLLQKEGFEVIGITLRFSKASKCCSELDVCDARKVAQKLGIEHYTIDVTGLFEEAVIDYFIKEYREGRTPNPCAVCNRRVKFKTLFKKADDLNAQFIATGHYARIQNKDNHYYLLKGKDSKKDQSYFLSRLKKEWLDYTIGQRKGIQVNINKPLYVISINPKKNTITVGEDKDVYKKELSTEHTNWLVPAAEISKEVFVKIRSQHQPNEAEIKVRATEVFVKFAEPQMAITPGQLAVFYKNDTVLGSGWISNQHCC